MKREKNFYYFLVMISYVICFCISLILSCRTVLVGNLTPAGSFIVYPMTYFLAILFAERYGKEETKLLFNYAAFAFIIMIIFITISSMLPVFNGPDGLEPIFNLNYRMVFASLTAFYVSQYLNLIIYYYISGFRGFKFLISGVISATIDSILFIFLAYVGEIKFTLLLQKFTSQYVLNIFMIILYTILFTYLIDSVIKTKPIDKAEAKANDELIKTKKTVKKVVTKAKTKKETKTAKNKKETK